MPQDTILEQICDSSPICNELSSGQAKFPRILSQNGQIYLEDQGQWPPFLVPVQSVPGYNFRTNLVILAQICDELSSGQAKFPRILSQNGQIYLEYQGQWLPFLVPVQSVPGCNFRANLVILAQICDELSSGQAKFPRILSQNGQIYLEDQGQWPPFLVPVHSVPGCNFRANLVILAQICDELSSGQAKFPRILSQNGQIYLEDQGQWPPFLVPVHSVPGCNFRANLVILAQICDKLSSGQAKFPRILSQNGQNDLEGQGQWLPFWIPAESITGCMFGTNLVVLAQVCDELLCRQSKKNFQNYESKWPKWPWRSRSMASIFSTNCEYPMMHLWCKFGDSSSNLWWVIIRTRLSLRTDGWMDGRTDGRTLAMTIPLRPERPRGENGVRSII